MKFEEFEKKIQEKGYGVAAMNHYAINGKLYTYCVVLNKSEDKAFQGESENSEEVFDKIYDQIKSNSSWSSNAPGRIRTCDPFLAPFLIRREVL